MTRAIEQEAGRLLPPAGPPPGNGRRHVPPSHPVLRGPRPLAQVIREHNLRVLTSPASRAGEPGPLASPQGHGIAIDAYYRALIEHVEHLVGLLGEADLQLGDLERYERALARGHAANLRRLARIPLED